MQSVPKFTVIPSTTRYPGAARWAIRLFIGIVVASPMSGFAAEPVRLSLKDHHFTPPDITVAANERFRIEVVNQDATPAEFESSDLRVEKIVVPGGTVSVMAGPLKPGTYLFFDDYHPNEAKGTVTAVAKE